MTRQEIKFALRNPNSHAANQLPFSICGERGKRWVSRKGKGGRSILPVRVASLLSYMSDARQRKNWHDFLTYRERLRALRAGRAEQAIPYFTGRPA